jgi:hypothetical protein
MKQFTKAEALKLVAQLQFHEMTAAERMGFQGCESENPLIAATNNEIVIIDDDRISIISAHGPDSPDSTDEQMFFLMGSDDRFGDNFFDRSDYSPNE